MANQPKEHDANEEGFQQDLMEDFFLDFKDAHQHCENTLIDWNTPQPTPHCSMICFDRCTPLKGI